MRREEALFETALPFYLGKESTESLPLIELRLRVGMCRISGVTRNRGCADSLATRWSRPRGEACSAGRRILRLQIQRGESSADAGNGSGWVRQQVVVRATKTRSHSSAVSESRLRHGRSGGAPDSGWRLCFTLR
jgi:hypothetical protein